MLQHGEVGAGHAHEARQQAVRDLDAGVQRMRRRRPPCRCGQVQDGRRRRRPAWRAAAARQGAPTERELRQALRAARHAARTAVREARPARAPDPARSLARRRATMGRRWTARHDRASASARQALRGLVTRSRTAISFPPLGKFAEPQHAGGAPLPTRGRPLQSLENGPLCGLRMRCLNRNEYYGSR